jgi:large subunit ribosomal protein L32
MPPLPKKKTAKARQGDRRAHLGIVPPVLQNCPQCHSPVVSHRVCPTCGVYKGREVIEIKTPKSKSSQ